MPLLPTFSALRWPLQVTIPEMLDNAARSHARLTCRVRASAALSAEASISALTSAVLGSTASSSAVLSAADDDAWRRECGYLGRPVQQLGPSRAFLAQYDANYTASWSAWLRSLSVGACMQSPPVSRMHAISLCISRSLSVGACASRPTVATHSRATHVSRPPCRAIFTPHPPCCAPSCTLRRYL